MRLTRIAFAPLVLLLLGIGPCGPIPGGRLTGTVSGDPSPDWSALVASTDYCQVEVRPSDPYSFTAVCFVVAGALHVGASGAPDKSWPGYVAADDEIRVRFGERIYPRRAILLTDPAERKAAFQAKLGKMGEDYERATPPADHWLYRLDPPQ